MTYVSPYLMECGKIIMGYPTCMMWEPFNCQWLMVPNTLYGMWEPCNCQWHLVPQTLYGMWEPCNRVPSHVQYDLNMVTLQLSMTYVPPYLMESGNIIMGYPTCMMWEPFNCQRLMVPNTWYGMWEPCNCQWLLVPQTLYGMWEPCNRVPSHVQYDLNMVTF